MLTLNPFIRISILVALGLSGVWLAFFRATADSDSGSWTGTMDAGLLLAGFFMFFFSMAGLVAYWIRSIQPPTTREDAKRWEYHRSIGKKSYVRRFLAKWTIPSFAVIIALASGHLWTSAFALGGVVFVIFLLVIVFVSLIGIARMFWDYNEREYNLLVQNKKNDQ